MMAAIKEASKEDRSLPGRLAALIELGPSRSKEEAVARLTSLQEQLTEAREEKQVLEQLAEGAELLSEVRWLY